MINFVKFGKISVPRRGLPFNKALKKVLGPKYELDLIFVPSPFMKNLNKIYRRGNKTTNVLSFKLADNAGQVFLILS